MICNLTYYLTTPLVKQHLIPKSLEPNPYLKSLVTSADSAPDPSIIKQK
jgi:hypothetical protein